MDFFNFLNTPIVEFILFSIAVWRISLMITSEDGFLGITYAIRLLGFEILQPKDVSKFEAWKNVVFSGSQEAMPIQLVISNHFGKLVSCIMCTSTWISLVGLAAMYFNNPYIDFFFYVMGFNGIAILIQKKGFNK